MLMPVGNDGIASHIDIRQSLNDGELVGSYMTSRLKPRAGGRKGKAVPLQAWSGPEVSRKLRFPDFMTTAQDGGKVVSLTHRPPLPTGNTPGTYFC